MTKCGHSWQSKNGHEHAVPLFVSCHIVEQHKEMAKQRADEHELRNSVAARRGAARRCEQLNIVVYFKTNKRHASRKRHEYGQHHARGL